MIGPASNWGRGHVFALHVNNDRIDFSQNGRVVTWTRIVSGRSLNVGYRWGMGDGLAWWDNVHGMFGANRDGSIVFGWNADARSGDVVAIHGPRHVESHHPYFTRDEVLRRRVGRGRMNGPAQFAEGAAVTPSGDFTVGALWRNNQWIAYRRSVDGTVTELLANTAGDNPEEIATDVSDDGSVVLAQARETGDYVFVWSEQNGIQIVPPRSL